MVWWWLLLVLVVVLVLLVMVLVLATGYNRQAVYDLVMKMGSIYDLSMCLKGIKVRL